MPAAKQTFIGRFSRRALLGAIASVPAAIGAVAAAGTLPATLAPTTPAAHPDAALFLLDREMEAAAAAMQQASKAAGKINRKCKKLYPPRPPEWNRPSTPDDILDILADMSFNDRQAGNRPEVRAWYKACDEQHATSQALHEAYWARVQEIKREHRLDAAEDAFEACADVVWRVGDRIFATPARTVEGMMVKIRAAERMDRHLFIEGNEACSSLAADIRRLAAGGAA
ncbi:hypothetical protein [Mesorhizobium sp. URHB0026]